MNTLKRRLFFDGAMGTMIVRAGLSFDHCPEELNLTHPAEITQIHKDYIEAGSNIITTNTFGANKIKFHSEQYSLEEVIRSAIDNARAAVCAKDAFVAFDVGPTGKLLEPMGELSFEETIDAFALPIRIATAHGGIDFILIETMSDLYELKAAVTAAQSCTDLPIICTVTVDDTGRMLTGADMKTAAAVMEDLGVFAMGLNCSLGPDKLLPYVSKLLEEASIPVIVQANAGLPHKDGEHVIYDITPSQFATYETEMAQMGVSILGGCCGTTPEHIRLLVESAKDVALPEPKEAHSCLVTCANRSHPYKQVKDYISFNGDEDELLDRLMDEKDEGVALAGVDFSGVTPEKAAEAVKYVQGLINLPLVFRVSDDSVAEAIRRIYNGVTKIILN